MKLPKVTLANCTPNPEKTIYAAWQIMHKAPVIPSDICVVDNVVEAHRASPHSRVVINTDSLKEVLKAIGNQAHGGVLEMVHFNFLLENVSRAFQQQLTRTRQAGYCIQSLRVVDVGNFADDENYLPLVDSVCELETVQNSIYKDAMVYIQEAYRNMIAAGVKVEDARGILPLAIFSPIWVGLNLRSLIHMLDQRFCVHTAGEFQHVAELMRGAIRKQFPMLAEAFLDNCGCERTHICTSAIPCGKYPKLGDTKNFKIEKDDKGNVETSWE